MDLGLTGKKALVAGGGRGIGKAIAMELAREGADVVVASRIPSGKVPHPSATSKLKAPLPTTVVMEFLLWYIRANAMTGTHTCQCGAPLASR